MTVAISKSTFSSLTWDKTGWSSPKLIRLMTACSYLSGHSCQPPTLLREYDVLRKQGKVMAGRFLLGPFTLPACRPISCWGRRATGWRVTLTLTWESDIPHPISSSVLCDLMYVIGYVI